MAWLDFKSCITSLVISLVEAVARLLCAPYYDDIKASIQAFTTPESVHNDSNKLHELLNQIKQMDASDEIDIWVKEVEGILQKVRSSNHNDDRLYCCNFGDGCSRCQLHKDIIKMTVRGNGIISRANLLPVAVEHICGVPNIEDGTTAGRNLTRVMNMLNGDEFWSIGVWGPGGVGKTTLVNALNNKLKSNSSFSLVRLISLTKDINENTVQKAIAKRLNLNVEEGMDIRDIANKIYNRLQREKFLLILDNVWESINLASIGIPENQRGSKVVLTTRLENVCSRMNAEAIKIGCLEATEAWQLFVEKAGNVVNNPEIQPLAKVVRRECGGLPLALAAVGSAMRGKTHIYQWQSAIDDMKNSNPPEGVESEVYKPLKLSFDFLANDILKSCFLYCSLYPEGYEIKVSELVQCWLAENIIDGQLKYKSAYSKGLDLIENLKNSCLVEDGCFKYTIKLHDVVRDVAIQIGKSDGTFVVFSGHDISKSPTVVLPEELQNIKWISFAANKKIELPEGKKDFPKVTTILICKTEEPVQVSKEFLQGFPALRVLNIYDLQSFPGSHLHLNELRALLLRPFSNATMEELPCGEKLMVLSLACFSFDELPKGVRQLTNLRVLDLSNFIYLKTIKVDIMLNLHALEILDTTMSGYRWPTKRIFESNEVVLQDLSRLKSLKEVYLDLADVEATYAECNWMERLESFSFSYGSFYSKREIGKVISIVSDNYNKVGSLILHAKKLVLENMDVKKTFDNFNPTDQTNSKLKSLNMTNCLFSEELTELIPNNSFLSNLESLSLDENTQIRSFSQITNVLGTTFPKLTTLYIGKHPNLENVFSSNYPDMVLPKLEKIIVYKCMNMEEVFHEVRANTLAPVPKLKCLYLDDLRSLQSLCKCELSEQCQLLQILHVTACPKLKKLPHLTSIEEIVGEVKWWSNLEWSSPETKSYMSQFFKSVSS